MSRKDLLLYLLALLVLMLVVNEFGLIQSGLALAQEGIEAQAALGTAFTYQGKLTDSGNPANGLYDFRFRLFDAASGGSQVGGMVERNDVNVSSGVFSTGLDFGGDAFTGQARWLELAVRPGNSNGSYTVLNPRQPLTAAPYALYATKAPWGGLLGIPAGFADGLDNDTTYTAGTGLFLNGAQFSVNTAAMQVRVTGTCAPGSSIRAIAADGSVTCEADDSGNMSVTAVYTSGGLGFSIPLNLNWIGQNVQVTVSNGQKVFVTGTKGLGSTVAGGGYALHLYICYQQTTGGDTLHTVGGGLNNLRVPLNSRIPFSLSTVIEGLNGTYKVGLCGWSTTPSGWNDAGWGYTTAIILP